MRVRWTDRALSDLGRLHAFLAPMNQPAAARVMQALVAAPDRLRAHPRLGARLDEFAPREIRRVFIGAYELRYELADDTVTVLRLWHAREDR